jgi:hypothetical protein
MGGFELIVKLEDLKSKLGITDDSQDAFLASIISGVQANIISYTKNCFFDGTSVTVTEKIKFIPANASDNAKIIFDPAGAGDFLEYGFYAGQTVAINATARNNGIKGIKEVAAEQITLDDGEKLINEALTGVIFVGVEFPADVVMAAFQISFDTAQGGGGSVAPISSEKVGQNYSVTYASGSNSAGWGDFPASVARVLKNYRKPKFIPAAEDSEAAQC